MAGAPSTTNVVFVFIANDDLVRRGRRLAIYQVSTFDDVCWNGKAMGEEAEERESVGSGEGLHDCEFQVNESCTKMNI